MATSTAEFRNLISNYRTITAASRASGNADPAIKGQLEGLQTALAPYVAEGFSAGGYDDAETISKDVANYIKLIDQNIASGKTPTKDPAADATNTKPNTTSENQNKAIDDNNVSKATTTAGKTFSQQTPTAANSDVRRLMETGPGRRTHNPLGDFSSYTYRISFYIVTPEAYNRYTSTGIWEGNDLYLVCQSGGSSTNPELDSQRASGFELDYYIDDLELITNTNGKEVGMPTNTIYANFKIYEPYGATFPTKLIDAAIAIQQKSDIKREINNVTEALWGQFLISIRFYGYDENGQVVTADKYNNGTFSKNIDSSATFERSFPVQVKDFKFSIEGKGQVYDMKTVCIGTDEGLSTKRATVSVDKSANGKNVEEALGGQGSTTNGLIDQLNKEQEGYVKGKTQELADEYAIVFDPNSRIGKALLVDETINKDKVPMTTVTGSSGATVRQSASASSGTMTASRTVKVASGTPIVQAIDQIITQSSYISEALKVLESEESQPIQQNDPLVDPNANPKTLQWYIIVPVTEVKGFDKKRNDYAVKITYVIKPYDVPYVKSTAIKYVPKYPGPHKIYNYWYTGKNSEVISYTQTYDIGYHVYASLATSDAINPTVNGVRIATKPVNGADTTGKAPGSFEGPNSIKTFLYSESDQLKAKIVILGDPDFLMPSTNGSIGQILQKWYGPDFTINPNTGQVFIELIFNQVEDYSNSDGLLTPNGNIDTMNFKYNPQPGIQEMVKGTVFMVVRVKSKFSKGRFSQEFQTILPNFSEMRKGTPDAGDVGGREEGKTNPATGNKPSSNPRTQSNPDDQKRLKEIQEKFKSSPNSMGGNETTSNANSNKVAADKEATPTANDDQVIIAGPKYKKEYKQATFYGGDLEREQAKKLDPANKSNQYYGLTGRDAYNPTTDPRRLDRR